MVKKVLQYSRISDNIQSIYDFWSYSYEEKMALIHTGGYTKAHLKNFALAAELNRTDLAQILGMSSGTFYRLAEESPLARKHVDRFFYIIQLYSLVYQRFNNNKAANNWFKTPLAELRNRRPLIFLNSINGIDEVKRIISQKPILRKTVN